jgi:hypothetical protein
MARTYRRDSNGRFASGGGGGSAKKSVRTATRGTNRLTRDNAGRITSVGGQGATARGGRLRTAAGNKRGAVVAKIGGKRSGVVGKPRGLKVGEYEKKQSIKASRAIKKLDAREAKASANAKKLRGEIKLAEMRRDVNPYPKSKAAAKKEKIRRQSLIDSLEKRLTKQYGAQVLYKQSRDKVYSKLMAVSRAKRAWSGVTRTNRKGVSLQRNLFGGSDAKY